MSELPKGWAEISTGEIANLLRGISYKKEQSSKFQESNFLPVLRANNLSGEIVLDDLVYVDRSLIKEEQVVRENDIIFAMSSGSKKHVGKCAIATRDIEASFGAFCGLLRTEKEFNAQFLAYYFRSNAFRKYIEKISKGTNINNLKREHVLGCTLWFPPLNEQKRIVAKIEELFSELDKGIESLKTAREQLKIYRQAVLKHAFEGKLTADWREENKDKLEAPEKLLERIQADREAAYQQQIEEWKADVKKWEQDGKEGKKPTKPRKPQDADKPNPDHLNKMWEIPAGWQWLQIGSFAFVTKLAGFEYTKFVEYDESGDLPVIKAENAGPNGYRITDYSKVKSIAVEHLTRSHLVGGELLVVFVGAGTGQVATVPHDQKYFLGPNIGMARPDTNVISTEYLELFLRSPKGKNLMLAAMKAVAQPSLSMGTIRQCPVAMPSPLEQEEIITQLAGKLSQIDRVELDIEMQLEKSESLRQSILKQAFSGKLVAQDPNDEPASVLLERIKAAHPDKKKKKRGAA